jgi:dTDP-L-rhamnose 4-epimerase
MKILVTGGAGFIGSCLVDSLIREGHKVRVLDNLDPQAHQTEFVKNEKAEYIMGDVKNSRIWIKAIEDIEIVYHFASVVGISQSMHKPVHFLLSNTIGTANFYEILLKKKDIRNKIRRVIIPGSKTIYGEGTYKCNRCGIVYPPLREKEQLERGDWEVYCPSCGEIVYPLGTKEDKPVNPISIYALSKYDTENIALNFGSAFDIPTLVFRGFSVYGPGQSLSNPYSGVCSIFLSRIKNNKQPLIFEDGGQLRDYIFIEDVIDFLMGMLDHDATGVYNLGTGKPTSVMDIVNILIDITGSDVQPRVIGDYRLGDNRHDFADISKLKRYTDFEPKWDIRKGLKKLVEWGDSTQARDLFEESEKARKSYFH